MPAIQPYKQGSVAPTEAMVTSPEKRWARVSCERRTKSDLHPTWFKYGRHTQVMTAAKNPAQIEAVAATAPCLEEKKVPTNAGKAEPVKIPVMF